MSPPALSGTAGHERGYLRPRTVMSASTGGDTCARGWRRLRPKTEISLDKYEIIK